MPISPLMRLQKSESPEEFEFLCKDVLIKNIIMKLDLNNPEEEAKGKRERMK